MCTVLSESVDEYMYVVGTRVIIFSEDIIQPMRLMFQQCMRLCQ